MVESIITSYTSELEQADGEGLTPLHLAASIRSAKICRLLVSKGANLDARTKAGKTALHIAVINGQYKIVDLLLDNGAEPHLMDSDGNTAVHCVPEERYRILRLLLDKGGNIDAKNSDGCTALFTAVSRGEAGLVKLLLENGAEISAKQPHCFGSIDETTWTPFQMAVMSGHVEIAKILLSSGSDVRVKTSQGVSVLWLAVHFQLDKMLEYLVTVSGVDLEETQSACVYSYRLKGHPERYVCQTVLHPPPPAGQECPLCTREFATIPDIEIVDRPSTGVCSALAYASWKGFAATVRILLDAQANVEACMATGNQRRPLHCAVISGDVETVESLLNARANIEAVDKIGSTALILSASWGYPRVVEALLDHGANLHAKLPSDDATALHQAAAYYKGPRSLEVIRLLIDRGARISDACNTKGFFFTPLHRAARNGFTDVVRLFLDLDVSLVNRYSLEPHGPPLHLAVYSRNVDTVQLLLERGAEINAQTATGGWTALLKAAREAPSTEIVQLLLEKGANVNAATTLQGLRALHMAASSGSAEIAQLLINKGADVNAPSEDGTRPLDTAAATEKSTGVMRVLLDNGANINRATDSAKNLSPLHLAASAGYTEIVSLLLERGADVNVSAKEKGILDVEGLPIHLAATRGFTQVVRLFLDQGVDINVKSEGGGDTPLNCAATEGKADVVRFLLERGARTDIKNVIWVSALRNAQLGSHTEVVAILKAFEASKTSEPKKKKKWYQT